MTRWLLRLWPEGIAARLGLLLLAGLAVFGIVAGLVYLDERRARAVEHFARALSVRMVAMVEALEEASPEGRSRLQAALSDRRLHVRLLAGRPQGADWLPPAAVDRDAAHHLLRLRPRPVLVRSGGSGADGSYRGPRIAVAVGLKEGVWAEFVIRPPYSGAAALIWLGLTALPVVGALVWGRAPDDPPAAPFRGGRRPAGAGRGAAAPAGAGPARIAQRRARLQPHDGAHPPARGRPHPDAGRRFARPQDHADAPAPARRVH